MSGPQTSFLDNLKEAVRENPLSAALIGGGAIWLLIGNQKLKSAANTVSAAASPLADPGPQNLRPGPSTFANSPPTASEMDNGSSQHVSETLHQATSAASDAVSGAAGAVKGRLDEGVTYARENFNKLGDVLTPEETLQQVRSSLSDLLEKQPLVLGAIGLAVGAAVAGAFSASDLENEWVGELSDSVKEELNARAGAVSQSVREASDTFKAEIDDVGAESLERLQQTGRSAMDAAAERLRTR
jgi:hypothetical protein